MYQTKKIIYKSVFKSGNDKETVEYKETGMIKRGEKTTISFRSGEQMIEISYDEHEVILKNNQSILRLKEGKDVLNEYQLPYGTVLLKTRMLNHKFKEDHFQLKYELYDNNFLISTVYIVINMISL